MMEDKYIKFYKTFDKRFKSNNNLILCSKTLSDSGVIHNSKLTGDNYGNKFLHLVNSDDCSDSIFLDFDRKMGKEKRYETTITRKLIDCCKTLSNCRVELTRELNSHSQYLCFTIHHKTILGLK